MDAIDETTETFAIEEEPVSKKPLNKPLTSLLKIFPNINQFYTQHLLN